MMEKKGVVMWQICIKFLVLQKSNACPIAVMVRVETHSKRFFEPIKLSKTKTEISIKNAMSQTK